MGLRGAGEPGQKSWHHLLGLEFFHRSQSASGHVVLTCCIVDHANRHVVLALGICIPDLLVSGNQFCWPAAPFPGSVQRAQGRAMFSWLARMCKVPRMHCKPRQAVCDKGRSLTSKLVRASTLRLTGSSQAILEDALA
eukprot:1150286-Pelagomonas_calceolata.AAC.2